jgi:hypothetical protein
MGSVSLSSCDPHTNLPSHNDNRITRTLQKVGGRWTHRGRITTEWLDSRQQLRTIYRNSDFRSDSYVQGVRPKSEVGQRSAADFRLRLSHSCTLTYLQSATALRWLGASHSQPSFSALKKSHFTEKVFRPARFLVANWLWFQGLLEPSGE